MLVYIVGGKNRYEEPIYPDVQERIHDYNGSLEYLLGSEYSGTSLDIYDSLINDYEYGIANDEPNEYVYQGPPYLPYID